MTSGWKQRCGVWLRSLADKLDRPGRAAAEHSGGEVLVEKVDVPPPVADKVQGLAIAEARKVAAEVVARETVDDEERGEADHHGAASTGATMPGGQEIRDGKAWMSLVEECVALLDELDGMAERLDPAARPIAAHVVARMEEFLERQGVSRIENEAAYDPVRHKPSPPCVVQKGTAILETLGPGLEAGGRVLRRAKVRVRPFR